MLVEGLCFLLTPQAFSCTIDLQSTDKVLMFVTPLLCNLMLLKVHSV